MIRFHYHGSGRNRAFNSKRCSTINDNKITGTEAGIGSSPTILHPSAESPLGPHALGSIPVKQSTAIQHTDAEHILLHHELVDQSRLITRGQGERIHGAIPGIKADKLIEFFLRAEIKDEHRIRAEGNGRIHRKLHIIRRCREHDTATLQQQIAGDMPLRLSIQLTVGKRKRGIQRTAPEDKRRRRSCKRDRIRPERTVKQLQLPGKGRRAGQSSILRYENGIRHAEASQIQTTAGQQNLPRTESGIMPGYQSAVLHSSTAGVGISRPQQHGTGAGLQHSAGTGKLIEERAGQELGILLQQNGITAERTGMQGQSPLVSGCIQQHSLTVNNQLIGNSFAPQIQAAGLQLHHTTAERGSMGSMQSSPLHHSSAGIGISSRKRNLTLPGFNNGSTTFQHIGNATTAQLGIGNKLDGLTFESSGAQGKSTGVSRGILDGRIPQHRNGIGNSFIPQTQRAALQGNLPGTGSGSMVKRQRAGLQHSAAAVGIISTQRYTATAALYHPGRTGELQRNRPGQQRGRLRQLQCRTGYFAGL